MEIMQVGLKFLRISVAFCHHSTKPLSLHTADFQLVMQTQYKYVIKRISMVNIQQLPSLTWHYGYKVGEIPVLINIVHQFIDELLL